jgi:hypothetical protein
MLMLLMLLPLMLLLPQIRSHSLTPTSYVMSVTSPLFS